MGLRMVSPSFPCLPCRGTALTSLPRGMPLPRAQVSPITLATKVLKVRYSFSTTPRRMVFISGIPEPIAPWRQASSMAIEGDTRQPQTRSSWGDP